MAVARAGIRANSRFLESFFIFITDSDSKNFVSKKVDAYSIKLNGKHLLIPLRDIKGKLWNLQKISPDGKKLFLKNGKVKGFSHIIGITSAMTRSIIPTRRKAKLS